jgi:hypothetical protein
MRSQTYAVFTVKKKMHPAMTRRHLPGRSGRWGQPHVALVLSASA